jgi:hypothetical protein
MHDIDELRMLCRHERPQPVLELLGQCVATLLSTDAIGEAERRKQASRTASGPPRPVDGLTRRKSGGVKLAARTATEDEAVAAEARASSALLSWEAARASLVRADVKTRIVRFDVRSLLLRTSMLAAVRSRIDHASIEPHLHQPHATVRLRDASGRRKDEGANAAAEELAEALAVVGLTPATAAATSPRPASPRSASSPRLASPRPASARGVASISAGMSPRVGSAGGTGGASPRQHASRSPRHVVDSQVVHKEAVPPSDGFLCGGGLTRGGGTATTGSVRSGAASPAGDGGFGGDSSGGDGGDGGGATRTGGGDGPQGKLTYDDAKFVSQSATAFLVWVARVSEAARALSDEWSEATAACKAAEARIDTARTHLETIRAKLVVAERDEASRLADLSEMTAKREHLRKLTKRLPNELTTTDLLLIPHRGQVRMFLAAHHALSLALSSTPICKRPTHAHAHALCHHTPHARPSAHSP